MCFYASLKCVFMVKDTDSNWGKTKHHEPQNNGCVITVTAALKV